MKLYISIIPATTPTNAKLNFEIIGKLAGVIGWFVWLVQSIWNYAYQVTGNGKPNDPTLQGP